MTQSAIKPVPPTMPGGTGAYADVNGLHMYYETNGGAGRPLVLLHGGLSATETSFGKLLPGLGPNRRLIAVEQQAHGRTADIDRPLSLEQMADDTAALLRQIGVEQADFFGYSIGAGVALQIAIRHPQLVHKLVLATVSYKISGLHPELVGGMDNLKPEAMHGTPFYQEYVRLAPRPQDWPRLVQRIKDMDAQLQDWPAESIRAVQAPALFIFGDSDIVRPEHAVEMFRLFGGGVPGDVVPMPKSQLAVLPGTSHITLVHRAEWLVPMITAFLDN